MPTEIEKTVQDLQQKEAELKTAGEELEKVSTRTAEENTKLESIKKEQERVRTDLDGLRKQRQEEEEKRKNQDLTLEQKLRKEALAKASDRIFSEFGYADEALKKQLLDEYARRDQGFIDSDNIYRELKRAHVALNPDKYIGLEAELAKQQRAAAEMNARMSSGGFAGAGNLPTQDVSLDEEDMQAIAFNGMPMETYKRLKKEGKI